MSNFEEAKSYGFPSTLSARGSKKDSRLVSSQTTGGALGSSVSAKPPLGRLLRFSGPSGQRNTDSAGTTTASPSTSSEALTRVGGIINSRNSVHRPPVHSRLGGAAGSLGVTSVSTVGAQNDLDLLKVYKHLRKDAERMTVALSCPYSFEDDAYDEVNTFSNNSQETWSALEGSKLTLEGFSEWSNGMQAMLQHHLERLSAKDQLP